MFPKNSSSNGSRSRSRSQTDAKANEAFLDDKCVDSNGDCCQNLVADDGVVLDLEDCCQMTICEKVRIYFIISFFKTLLICPYWYCIWILPKKVGFDVF